ncbi:zinc-iron transporter [Entamoeba marina]
MRSLYMFPNKKTWIGYLGVYIVAIFIISIIGGLLPFMVKLLKRKELAQRVINILTVASGGLFLGGGLNHMISESSEKIESSGFEFAGLPLCHFLVGFTFLSIFFVDRVIVPHQHTSFDETDKHIVEMDENTTKEKDSDDHSDDHSGMSQEINKEGTPTQSPAISPSPQTEIESTNELKNTTKNSKWNAVGEFFENWTSLAVLLAALSIHSFLSGLGLGAAEDPLMIFIAIFAHKWADTAMAVLFMMKKVRSWIVILIALGIFSLFTPVGAILGNLVIASLDDKDVSNLVQGILMAIGGGSFLFVATIEILAEAFEVPHGSYNHKHYVIDKYIKFGLAMILYLAISSTTFLEGGHEH